MPDNIENVCRLCLSKEGLMLPIFRNHIQKNEASFRSKIMSCASIEVFSDDELPSKVCFVCMHQVEKFFQFQAMCQNSDAVLQSQLKESTKTLDLPDDNVFSERQFCTVNDKTDFMCNYFPQTDSFPTEKSNYFTCFCSCSFETNEKLIDHITKTHSDCGSYTCKSCKISFPDILLYKNHVNLVHSLSCSYCDCVFKYHKSYREHLKTHSQGSLACKYCKKLFSNIIEMKKHERVHAEKMCSYCSIEFESQEEYIKHTSKCLQLYSCKFCNQQVQSKKELIEHVNSCHENAAQCSETFNSNLQEDSADQSLLCTTCEMDFPDETSLLAHMTEKHKNDVLTCKFCTKKFSLKSSLKRHEKLHLGVKPYQCKFCPRKFKDSSACVVHTRTHTGEHPFRCQYCHKDFKQIANLKMHTYRHHKKNQRLVEEKPEIINQANEYEQLYTGEIVEAYTDDMRGYQHLNDSISTTFNQSMNLLISDHR